MAKEKSKPKRSRGQIETLPSGSLRVSLYAGTDPVTKDRMYLRETVPAGPNAEAQAGRILAGFIHEVYERRHPRTDATVRQLIERHLVVSGSIFHGAAQHTLVADLTQDSATTRDSMNGKMSSLDVGGASLVGPPVGSFAFAYLSWLPVPRGRDLVRLLRDLPRSRPP